MLDDELREIREDYDPALIDVPATADAVLRRAGVVEGLLEQIRVA
jgi:hypothetical protein